MGAPFFEFGWRTVDLNFTDFLPVFFLLFEELRDDPRELREELRELRAGLCAENELRDDLDETLLERDFLPSKPSCFSL